MVTSGGWLIDKSAIVRLAIAEDAQLWEERIQRGLVRISPITLLELGFSARSAADWDSIQHAPPVSDMPIEGSDGRAEARALEIQGRLAVDGKHRAPSVPDLLVAATGEMQNLTVLHVDKDFDLIAGITGQSVERLVGDF